MRLGKRFAAVFTAIIIAVGIAPVEPVFAASYTVNTSSVNTTLTTPGNILVDISGQPQNVDTAVFDYNSFVNLANAVNTVGSLAMGVQILMPTASVTFEGSALYTIAAAAYTGNQAISVNVSRSSIIMLNAEQKSALSNFDVVATLSARTFVGTTEITNFGGGYETISIPYMLTGDQVGQFLTAYAVDEKGITSPLMTSYVDGYVTFITDHGSDFVIVYDRIAENNVNNMAATTPVYRAYNPVNGDHLFTVNTVEHKNAIRAGWLDEGQVFSVNTTGTIPVFRLYDPKSGEHMYTISTTERAAMERAGWNYEGESFYVGGAKAVFRLMNPNRRTNNHLFTVDATEKSKLVAAGWVYEDVAFYVN